MEQRGEANSFLGKGFHFPIQVDPATGRIRMSAYEEDIKEAIYLILMTRKGERIRNRQFGCGIHDFTFGTMDFTSLKEMERSVEKALIIWEPRIREIQVGIGIPEQADGAEASGGDGCLEVEISYVVRTTNNPFNLVFPFYLNEGFGKNL